MGHIVKKFKFFVDKTSEKIKFILIQESEIKIANLKNIIGFFKMTKKMS